jgi:activating signal cointegrator 1
VGEMKIELPLKCLTISQPYASLIAGGEKWVENRSWYTSYRGQLGIHAGKGSQYLDRDQLAEYPTGAIIAVARLRSCMLLPRIQPLIDHVSIPDSLRFDGVTLGDLRAIVAHEHAEGPYCWILGDVRKLPLPIPCRGSQGLWCFRGESEVSRG